MRIDNIVNRGRLPAPKRRYLGGALLLAMVVATVLLLSGPGDGASAAGTNDSFAKATVYTTSPVSQSTAGFTTEAGEPQPCGAIGATAWFTYTPTVDTNLQFNTVFSDFNTVLAVYTGSSLTNLKNIACNDDHVTAPPDKSVVTFLGRAGVTYRIQAGGASGGSGSLTLNIGGGVPKTGIPTLVNYQGRLTTAGGSPVADGGYNVTFRIFDAATGGTQQWTETQKVAVSGGLFNVLLGSNTALTASVFNGNTRYLEVQVGADPAMAPRQRLVSVPYALQANGLVAPDGQTFFETPGTGWTSDTALTTHQDMAINADGPDGDGRLYFYESGALSEYLQWRDAFHAFQFTDDVFADSYNLNSDRNLKANFAAVDEQDVLERMAKVPIETWNFKDDAAVRHVGPTAQDFSAALASLGVSTDAKTINLTDANGVALASIQALYDELKVERARNDSLEGRLDALEGKAGGAPAPQAADAGADGAGTPWLVIALAAAALVLIPTAGLLGRAAVHRARS